MFLEMFFISSLSFRACHLFLQQSYFPLLKKDGINDTHQGKARKQGIPDAERVAVIAVLLQNCLNLIDANSVSYRQIKRDERQKS